MKQMKEIVGVLKKGKIMKMIKRLSAILLVAMFALGVSACNNITKQDIGAAGGAAGGALIGHAVTGGSTAGTVIGGATGALVGSQVGKQLDKND